MHITEEKFRICRVDRIFSNVPSLWFKRLSLCKVEVRRLGIFQVSTNFFRLMCTRACVDNKTHIHECRHLAKNGLLRRRALTCIRRMSDDAAPAQTPAQPSGGLKRALGGFAIGVLASVYVLDNHFLSFILGICALICMSRDTNACFLSMRTHSCLHV